ncbi:hypothetical protein SASPL_148585 [Salvia splendens]|uniref:Dynamin GTPase n=1 Tax=Salvia splendens TaxID=180675 RepID=A0A8X8W9C4_SALSN|nr:hypothetical protein SASPL_148585 [Salvia splendens]
MAKEDMLFKLYSSRSAQSMARIEELLGGPQSAASTYSNEKVQQLLAHIPGRMRSAFDAAANSPSPIVCRPVPPSSGSVYIFQAAASTYSNEKVQQLLAHIPGRMRSAFDAAANGPSPIVCRPDSKNAHIYHSELFTLTEKMAKGDAEKLYFTSASRLCPSMLPEGKFQVVQDELSRLGEQMVHSSEGKRPLARVLCHELHDKFLQHVESPSVAGPSSGRSGDAAFDAAASGPNPSYVDSRSNGPSRWNSDPFQNGDINPGCLRTSLRLPPAPPSCASVYTFKERGVDLDRLYEMEEKGIEAIIRCTPGRKLVNQFLGYFVMVQFVAIVSPITRTILKDSENAHIYHSKLFTLTEKMAKGEPQKLYFTVPIFEPHP